MMFQRWAIAFACIAVTSCVASPDDAGICGHDPIAAPERSDCNQCDTQSDCVARIDVCLVCICRDGECAVHDLRHAPRPTDERSGLPMGRGCAGQE